MDFGVSMFVTDYAIAPAELAKALEERGFESMWAPEHSHIPVARQSPWPGGGELPRPYYEVMDPFVVLSHAAAATKKLKLGTGVCLVIQRDPIQTAKLVASIDQVSGGRFLFGIGGGWNAEEIANHGTAFKSRFKLMRERIEAMKEIWTKNEAEYHGEFVDFAPVYAWPKPVQKPYPPIILGGAFPHAARRAVRYGNGWVPIAGRGPYGDINQYLPLFKEMLAAAGRTLEDVPITLFGGSENVDTLKRHRDMGVARTVVTLPPAKADQTLPALDRWAELIRRVNA
ncbi:MAG: LLM class F420-dependent oxidoreductase [Alphaproteobacteria bacterium]|nr:LLM class F420-dependent oxidoreductase [Alphaproteobacteria bacterium]